MISLDSFEGLSFDAIKLDLTAKLKAFNESFRTKVTPENGFFQSHNTDVDKNFASWLGVDSPEAIAYVRPNCFEAAKTMLKGIEVNGKKTLGLLDISKMKINPEYKMQNIKQQAGFSAEVISTAKENIRAVLNGSELITKRADDCPDLFPKNDQYVDKVRINAKGEIVEKIQTKFVGKNAAENLNKLTSSKYDKYFKDGKVDKIEIPSNFYDDVKNKLLPGKLRKLENQLERVKADGKVETVQKIEGQIERLKMIDNMIEKSTVSSNEAIFARLHPKLYTAKLFLSASHETGVKSGLTAAGLTAAISTVDNIQGVMKGEITIQEAFIDVAKDVGTAGAIGYGVGFVSPAVAGLMSNSSHTLIKSLGKANVPAAVISFGMASYDSVIDYAQGKISGEKLAIDLGESATGVLGSMTGAALSGAALGSVVPGAGNVAGFAVGLVGGMVGYALSTEAYATAVEAATGGVGVLADKAQAAANTVADAYSAASAAVVDGASALKDKALEMGQSVIDSVASSAPEALDDVKNAMNDFASRLGVPIHF